MEKIDLHIHSSYSDDADIQVDDIVELAEKASLSLISITDHNSAKSASDGISLCSTRNIGFIPGIEVDVSFKGRNFHLLGYGYNKNSHDFELIESNFFKLQQKATPIKIQKLKDFGFLSMSSNYTKN